MKRILFVILAIIITASMLLIGCGPKETATSTATATATATATHTATATATHTATATVTSTTSPLGDLAKPPGGKDGGRLQLVSAGGILNLGDIVDQVAGPGDAAYAFPCVEPLLYLDGSGQFQPWLAERFEIADDFSSITLWLRHGVKFHDGTTFDAAAVKYILDVAIANPIYTNARSLESPVIIDDYTIRVDFIDGQWNWDGAKGLASWWGEMMFSPKSLQENDSDWRKTHVVGTGPFILTEYVRDQKLIYERNPNYWRGVPYLEGIDYNIIPDFTTQLLSYKAGEVHMIGVQLKDVDRLQSEGFTIIQSEDMIFNYALIPSSKDPTSPLADIRVRQAVQYAIDQQAIIDGITYGYGKTTNQEYCIAPYKDDTVVGYPYDPVKARELLALAGYGPGVGCTLTINMGDATPMDVPLALQDMFADVGITLVINKVSSLQIGAIIMSTGWDGFMFSFAFPGKTIDPGFTASIYMNHGGVWISTLQPDDVQALCDAAAYEPDQTARIALYQQISKMMADEYCLHQYIYYQGSFSSITPFLKGYTIGEYTEFYAFTYSYLDYD